MNLKPLAKRLDALLERKKARRQSEALIREYEEKKRREELAKQEAEAALAILTAAERSEWNSCTIALTMNDLGLPYLIWGEVSRRRTIGYREWQWERRSLARSKLRPEFSFLSYALEPRGLPPELLERFEQAIRREMEEYKGCPPLEQRVKAYVRGQRAYVRRSGSDEPGQASEVSVDFAAWQLILPEPEIAEVLNRIWDRQPGQVRDNDRRIARIRRLLEGMDFGRPYATWGDMEVKEAYDAWQLQRFREEWRRMFEGHRFPEELLDPARMTPERSLKYQAEIERDRNGPPLDEVVQAANAALKRRRSAEKRRCGAAPTRDR